MVDVEIEQQHVNNRNKGIFKASIESQGTHDIFAINQGSIKLNGVPAFHVEIEDDELVAEFNAGDINDVHENDSVLMIVTGEFNDGKLFEGFEKVIIDSKLHER